MKKANKFAVKTKFGTFTRSTNNNYKFLVISSGTAESYLIDRAAREDATTKNYIAQYTAAFELATATGKRVDTVRSKGKPVVVENPKDYGNDAAKWKEYLDDDVRRLAESPDRLAAKLEANRAEIAEGRYGVHGWSSRYELAVKVAEQARKFGAVNVKIIAVEGGEEA